MPKFAHFSNTIWKIVTLILFIILAVSFYFYNSKTHVLDNQIAILLSSESNLKKQLTSIQKELADLKNTDQVKKNLELEDTIKKIETTYKRSVTVYEKILDFQGASKKNQLTADFAKALNYLSERNYASASATLDTVEKNLVVEQAKTVAAFTIPATVKESNTPPSSGYSQQKVTTDVGDFLVDIVSADLGSTRVIVDTASDSDCRDNCPVMSLGDYVGRNGAFAGINGGYFCPAEYPSCAGKTNSFDTLAMNKNKHYFNSDNNVYSQVPAVIFYNGGTRYVGATQDWGRDTSVDGVLANQPLLLSGGNVAFGGSGDPKQGSKGNRSFVASKGNMVYIGVVRNATVAEVARVLHKMGMSEALNLDSGGSTALWSGGYKIGPGRNIPNAILFTRK